jgi:hypothetical protein
MRENPEDHPFFDAYLAQAKKRFPERDEEYHRWVASRRVYWMDRHFPLGTIREARAFGLLTT